MTLIVERYIRKAFRIDAVEVTEDNINEVAEWCHGEVRSPDPNTTFIKVRVHRPLNERQTKAFVGDRVLYAGVGFKVYTPKAFASSFVKVDDNGNILEGVANEDAEVAKNVQ